MLLELGSKNCDSQWGQPARTWTYITLENRSAIFYGRSRMEKNKGLVLATFLLLLAFMAAAAQVRWKGKIVKEGDAAIVLNTRDPIYREPILTLKEELALGGEKAQGEAAYSSARRIAVDKDGNIYVGDSWQACIKVFDKAGAYLRTIGRRGQGPGELTLVDSIAVSRDNQELIVGDIGKLIVFDLQGQFKRNLTTSRLNSPDLSDGRGNVFVHISDIREKRSIYRVFGPDMATNLADIAIIPNPPDLNMYSPRAYWILDPQGRLVFGYPKTYEISYYDEHFKVVKKIRREYEPARVTDEDKKIYLKRSNPPGAKGPPKYPCPSDHAAFRSFFSDDQGRLFVQTWERTPDGKQDIHDVYDAEGRFFGRFPLNAHPDLINPTPTILKNNKLYTVEVDEEGYEIVKRYSVAWKH